MIPYLYGLLCTPGVLFEHWADVRGRLWTSWIEPWVRIPPPPFPLDRLHALNRMFPLMSLSVTLTAERGKYQGFRATFIFGASKQGNRLLLPQGAREGSYAFLMMIS